jgi:glycosyltransferase involved in cell wall biosynthesis
MTGMPWGGSEELWWRAARLLQSDGHQISVNYKWWPETARQLVEIQSHGGQLWLRGQPKSFLAARTAALKSMIFSKNGSADSWLHASRPDAVLVTLGYHPDQVLIASDCHRLGIPYAINVQCASNFFFIHSDRLDEYRHWYKNAQRVFFVSDENKHKLETNIAARLDNAEIVANPFNVHLDADPDWPNVDSVFRVACVGRIHFQSKGQDLVVDVMKQDKWKNRPIEITFYGHDQGNQRQLEELIKLHGLEGQLKFSGFVNDVASIWEQNHALLLPSRYEGAPLVIIEAMLCRRIPITTNIGRNLELIDDNQTGFVARGATIELLDDALERAWAKRDQWRSMGRLAGHTIRQRYPADPIREFADKLSRLSDISP